MRAWPRRLPGTDPRAGWGRYRTPFQQVRTQPGCEATLEQPGGTALPGTKSGGGGVITEGAGEDTYLQAFSMTEQQRRAVRERDWLGMLKLGGNIYYTIKVAFCDGLTFQDVAGMMSGVPKETYAQMMLAGGRSPEGNRSKQAGKPEIDRG